MAYNNPYGNPAGYPPAAPTNSSTATISLIMGILGLTLLPFLGSIVALFTGYSAKKEIDQSGGVITGGGMATAGIIMGWIGVALGVIGCCVGAFFGLVPCLAAFGITLSEQRFWLPFLSFLPFI